LIIDWKPFSARGTVFLCLIEFFTTRTRGSQWMCWMLTQWLRINKLMLIGFVQNFRMLNTFFNAKRRRAQRGAEIFYSTQRFSAQSVGNENTLYFLFLPQKSQRGAESNNFETQCALFFQRTAEQPRSERCKERKAAWRFFTLLSVFLRNLWEILDLQRETKIHSTFFI